MVQLNKHRLNESGMYKKIYQNNKKWHDLPIKIKVHYTSEGVESKMGFIIKKKIGKAVFRNQLKRILREVFFKQMPYFKSSCWILFEIMPFPVEFSLSRFRKKAEQLLQNV